MCDKVVVLTGASRGLGAEIAVAFACRGARVALLARSPDLLKNVADRVQRSGGRAMVCPTNLRHRHEVQNTVVRILKEWERIDILVNGAGTKREGPIEEVDPHDAMETLEVNYLGALACCQAVLPTMRQQHAGHIINVSSVLGKRATPFRGIYSASKAALNALTEALRVELMGSGILVTLVCPGRLADSVNDSSTWFAMANERAASRVVRCAERPRRELVLTPAGRVLVWLNFWAPNLLDQMLRRARTAGV